MLRLILAAVVLSLLAPRFAYAHDRKEVGGFRLTIGWGDEPAFSGLKNAIEVDVADIQFPMKDPSAGELAARMTRELTRAGSATDTADTARTLSIAALAAAVIGVVAAVGFRRRTGSTRP